MMEANSGSRVAVVTGANKGIGYAAVMELCAKFDGTVYLTSRDESRGRKAVDELEQMGLRPAYHQLDIDDESSVLKFRDHLVETHGGLDVLINNAAIIFPMTTPAESFVESIRKTIDTNFYHTMRACKILFPILRPHARVVHLTSDDGHLLRISGREPEAAILRSKFSAPDLTEQELCQLMEDFIDAAKNGDRFERGWPNSVGEREDTWPNEGYIVSKVGISALTRIHQRQFDQDLREDLAVNCVHPGYVITDATFQKGEKTIQEGAEAACWLAMLPPSSPDNVVPKGAYVWHDKQLVDWVNGPTPSIY
ncbi:hypothetical protein OUZ56_020675 [Daphnia magna]|uniref:Carbonyl reductase n=1 Tax=Daphnia magna TaxID=35525 RepID=A0ABQ9ZF40_9CRUS|nr:hypothetical protein OUZ56_020675 [Daphnia magna]